MLPSRERYWPSLIIFWSGYRVYFFCCGKARAPPIDFDSRGSPIDSEVWQLYLRSLHHHRDRRCKLWCSQKYTRTKTLGRCTTSCISSCVFLDLFSVMEDVAIPSCLPRREELYMYIGCNYVPYIECKLPKNCIWSWSSLASAGTSPYLCLPFLSAVAYLCVYVVSPDGSYSMSPTEVSSLVDRESSGTPACVLVLKRSLPSFVWTW